MKEQRTMSVRFGTSSSTAPCNTTGRTITNGEGVLVPTWPVRYGYSCCTTTNATVCYNVFERDGEKQAGGITLFGGVTGWIYNNTVYNGAARPDRYV